MATKIQGYLLFYAGILTILYCAFNLYQVFTGNLPPNNLFELPPLIIDAKTLSQFTGQPVPDSASIELLSASLNSRFANLFAHLVLVGFLAGVGQKIASLGAYFLRPIHIQVKETLKEVSAF